MRTSIRGLWRTFDPTNLINAYAKFGGENTPKERVGHRSAEAAYLKGLLALAEGTSGEAKQWFGKALTDRPGMIWAKYLTESSILHAGVSAKAKP